ncbi:MAG: ABC transporter ATP-binding protein [Oscillospiraceae bacterium]|nr:ABC transporter ATP-binding protein [Oscillospiraceae bacterium]
MAVLKIEDLFCGYGKKDIVKGISFELPPGEILSVIGPNGCGKTTLLRAAAGLLPIRSGGVYLDGQPVTEMSHKERAKHIALLSQTGTGGDYFDYTVYETVAMGRYAHRDSIFSEASGEDEEAVRRCMDEVGLTGLEDESITRLSGGQLQRVFLARAFVQEPDIIFLDEPANHLDLKYVSGLITLLKKWVGSGRSAVGVFHDPGLAAAVSDRIMLMDEGQSVLCDTPSEVLLSERMNEVFETDVGAYMKMVSAVFHSQS